MEIWGGSSSPIPCQATEVLFGIIIQSEWLWINVIRVFAIIKFCKRSSQASWRTEDLECWVRLYTCKRQHLSSGSSDTGNSEAVLVSLTLHRNSSFSENSILPRFFIYQTVQFKSQISVHVRPQYRNQTMGLHLIFQGSEFTQVAESSGCHTLKEFQNILFSPPPKAALCLLDFTIPLVLLKDAGILFHIPSLKFFFLSLIYYRAGMYFPHFATTSWTLKYLQMTGFQYTFYYLPGKAVIPLRQQCLIISL